MVGPSLANITCFKCRARGHKAVIVHKTKAKVVILSTGTTIANIDSKAMQM